MQKVYLLLRNNQQTGPHSLEELLQAGLKPMDLIWVEGKSFGWSYPSEIEALKPFLTTPVAQNTEPYAPPASAAVDRKPVAKHVFVSLPIHSVPLSSSAENSLEQKAEALRKRAQSYIPQSSEDKEAITTNYARSLDNVEEQYTSWLYQKKTKKKSFTSKKPWIITGLAAVVLIGGWSIVHFIFSNKTNDTVQLVLHTDNKEQEPVQSSSIAIPPPVYAAVNESKPLKQTVVKNTGRKTAPKKEVTAASPTIQFNKIQQPDILPKEPANQPEQNPGTAITKETNEPPATPETKEKKKTLKQILGGLFKKNKKEETVQEDPQPAGNNHNERNAVHRDETASTTVDVADQVEIKMNKSSSDWMMGVQGLKLTLYNRSAVTIKTASVEVLYYSEQNELLEKKTIVFSNIASQKSQTVAAPNHRLADHADYRIIAVTGLENK